MYRFLCALILILLSMSLVCCDSPTLRQTENGPIEGLEELSVLGKTYYSFRGVPYAEVPITGIDPYTGAEVDRRFKATEPIARKWTEPFKAHDYGDNCIPTTHFFPKNRNVSENCLFVNIFVPAGGAKKKTVLVWIHGGGFTDGSGDDLIYGPDFMMEVDTILVTMNYRLGIFGFMNLGFGEYTGNMGMKDQQMALKWIHENIKYFSGNKDEILLGGVSAGGASVHYHTLNEESRSYFQRAFIVSGAALNYFALYEPDHYKRVQECFDIEDKTKLIEYLKSTDSKILAECYTTRDFGKLLVSLPWVPTIENPSTKGAFLTKSPEDILNSNEAPMMDILFSFTSEESVLFYPDIVNIQNPLLAGDWIRTNVTLPFYGFVKQSYPVEFRHAVTLLEDAYFPDPYNVDAIQRGNINLLSELSINYGILKSVKLHVEANNQAFDQNCKNTFVQRFSANLDLNWLQFFSNVTIKGATHGDDLCYLFYCHLFDDSKVYEKHLKDLSNPNFVLIRRMVKMVTNFARTGNPSIEYDTPLESITSPDEILVHDIESNSRTRIITNILEQTHFNAWQEIDEIYKKMYIDFDYHIDYCNAPTCDEK